MLTSAPHLYIRRPSPTTAEFTVTTCPRLTLPLRIALLGVLLLRIITIFLVLLALYTQYGAAITTVSYPYAPFASSSAVFARASPTGAGQQHHNQQQYLLSSSSGGREGPIRWWSNERKTNDPYVTIPEPIQYALLTIASTPLGESVAQAVSMLPTWAFLSASAVLLYIALFRRIHTTESVLVLRGLGIQTSSSSSGGIWGFSYIGRLLGLSGGSGSHTHGTTTTGKSKSTRSRNMPACLAIGNNNGGDGKIGGVGVGNKTRFIPTAQIQDVLINEAFIGFEVRYYLVVVVEGEEDLVVLFPSLLPGRRIVETVWREVKACLYEQASAGGGNGGGNGHVHHEQQHQHQPQQHHW
ncbi:phosphatidylinositol N-acetylglucosaminyltransferase [Naviculisporaceae sp. PSN 640]